jgi:hypothetical protein
VFYGRGTPVDPKALNLDRSIGEKVDELKKGKSEVLENGHSSCVSSSLLGPVDPSFRALSGRLKLTVRRHKFNNSSFSFGRSIGEKVDELKKGKSKVLENGHSLILGWNDKALAIIQAPQPPLSVPRRACLSRGGPVRPEAGLSVSRRFLIPRRVCSALPCPHTPHSGHRRDVLVDAER